MLPREWTSNGDAGDTNQEGRRDTWWSGPRKADSGSDNPTDQVLRQSAYEMLYGKTPFADPRIMNHEGGLVNHAFRDKFLPQICAYLMLYGKTPFADPRIMNHEGGLVNHAFRDKFLPQICAYLMLYGKTPFPDALIVNHEGGHALYDRMYAFLRVLWNVSVADYHKE